MCWIEPASLTFQNFIQHLWEKKVYLKKIQILSALPTVLQTESQAGLFLILPHRLYQILHKPFFNSLTLHSSIMLKKIVQLLVMMTEFSPATKAYFPIMLMMWKTVDYLAHSSHLTKLCLFPFKQISSKYTQKRSCLLTEVWLYKLVYYFSPWTEFLLVLIGLAYTL